jgi:hypothetical protein
LGLFDLLLEDFDFVGLLLRASAGGTLLILLSFLLPPALLVLGIRTGSGAAFVGRYWLSSKFFSASSSLSEPSFVITKFCFSFFPQKRSQQDIAEKGLHFATQSPHSVNRPRIEGYVSHALKTAHEANTSSERAKRDILVCVEGRIQTNGTKV